MNEQPPPDESDVFHPRGTVLFLMIYFVTLLVLWSSVYMILLSRGVTQ